MSGPQKSVPKALRINAKFKTPKMSLKSCVPSWTNYITQALSGHILGKNGVYYRTSDVNLGAVLGHINTNKVDSIDIFLESILGD